ncbi:MAG: DNA double-strand break repair nuclease NurA [Candidatus Nitrosocosmicus sp.]
MLSDLYIDVIKNKEQRLSLIHDDAFPDVLKQASSRWIDYSPLKRETYTAGIDSSWNKRSYQGVDLFVIDSVAVTSFNQILFSTWNYGVNITSGDSLNAQAMTMEINLASSVLDMEKKPDILCIDGSIISNILHNKSSSYANKIQNLLNKNNKNMDDENNCLTLFISKNSNTKNQFKEYGSKAADIYYFNKLGFEPGFSVPNVNTNPNLSEMLEVVEIYARLSPFVPLIKIEIANNNNLSVSINEVKKILNGLFYHSINGYPYCLKLAHKSCKISNADVKRIASVYGLKNEFGSRDSLNE